MRYLNFIFGILIAINVMSCQNKKKEHVNPKKTETVKTDTKSDVVPKKEISNKNHTLFFTGEGENWNLKLNDSILLFSSEIEGFESVVFPIPKPILAADANVKLYRAETERAFIKATISMGNCDISNKTLPYSVTIEIKQNKDSDFKNLKGCGAYITDYRLHDIWVLETLKEEQISADQFTKELPNLEINTTDNSFMGYAGCNTMRGNIFSEQSKIRFTKIITTRKLCAPTNKEAEFLKALESSTQFKIENNRLYLSNPDQNTLTFKKVD